MRQTGQHCCQKRLRLLTSKEGMHQPPFMAWLVTLPGMCLPMFSAAAPPARPQLV